MKTSLLTYQESTEALSLKEKIGQFFMPAAFINDSEDEIEQLEQLIRDQGVGGLCFFHSRASAATNFEGKKKVLYNEHSFITLQKLIKRYQSVSKNPLLIAIDAEWGLAMRVENSPQYPYAITLGAIQANNELIFKVGKNIARDCKMVGVHWNLAPCIDLNNNPYNPVIGYRSFGEDKNKVVEKALAFVKGTQSEGILTSIKHFPGHGDTATDSHLGLPLIDKSKEELVSNELYPFQKLIHEGIDSVMVGHLSVPSLARGKTNSSSISKEIIKDLLRSKMGYDGVVISDALNMHAVSKNFKIKGELEWLAFDAGNDVLCFAEHVPEAVEMILNRASAAQIEESFQRIWKLKEKALLASRTDVITNGRPEEDHALNRNLAEKSLSLFKGTEADIKAFRETDYRTLTLKRVQTPSENADILLELEKMKSAVGQATNILIQLTPPQIKPTNRFGLLEEEIQFINSLLQTKNVILYLFGNPYTLNHLNIDEAKVVVIAYQNFKEFEAVAAAHFLGQIKAKGSLPVSFT